MVWSASFFANAALLGVGLAMDAFSVSMADGLSAPDMGPRRMALIAGTFGGFQFLMPMVGWLCVRAAAEAFRVFQMAVPWLAAALLGWIGGGMLYRSGAARDEAPKAGALGTGALLAQGVATSVDALSVGFTIQAYGNLQALAASSVIAAVTFALCVAGLLIGRRFGTRLSGGASILGGSILLLIGLRIFLDQ